MARLEWDKEGERRFETGVDRGVLYTDFLDEGFLRGVPWNGLISVDESSESTASEFFLDGVKYLDAVVPGDYKATISAFTYPDQFEPCLGVREMGGGLIADQTPARFALSYRTKVGDDVAGVDAGYKIHLIYNAVVVPAGATRTTIGENVEASDFSWAISATPVLMPGAGIRPTAHIVIDSTRYNEAVWGAPLSDIEDLLWGGYGVEPSMIPMENILAILLDLDL